MPVEQQNGLGGVAAATTKLSQVEGGAGRLILAGYAVETLHRELASKAPNTVGTHGCSHST